MPGKAKKGTRGAGAPAPTPTGNLQDPQVSVLTRIRLSTKNPAPLIKALLLWFGFLILISNFPPPKVSPLQGGPGGASGAVAQAAPLSRAEGDGAATYQPDFDKVRVKTEPLQPREDEDNVTVVTLTDDEEYDADEDQLAKVGQSHYL